LSCYVFDKLDGSQIRAEWSRKQGFYKFGTRKRLLGEDDPLLGEARGLFSDKYADDLGRVFVKQRWDKAVVFCEFWGERSFAGSHWPEPHTVTLFDVAFMKKGLLSPKDFLKLFGHLDIAKLLHRGNVNEEFMEQVRRGTLEGMTFEGVVCKGTEFLTPGRPLMFKVKNLFWIDKLKEFCKRDPERFNFQELL
jgi:hypothetical protein